MKRSTTYRLGLASAALSVAAVTGLAMSPAGALLAPGTPAKDVHVGLDNDNADNPFIQPPGVTAKQHMDNTDVLVGRANHDLLIGNLGGDTLLGNGGSDILVGGPEGGAAPNSDVLLGEGGDDINIWAPGDGSDAFVGHVGYDSMIFAPFLTNDDGSLDLDRFHGRRIPGVKIDELPQFSCTIVRVPPSEHLGFDFLVRFNVGPNPVVTVRQEKVEKVYCPSPDRGTVLVADLTRAHPRFRSVDLEDVPGTVGAIMAPRP